MLTAFQCETIAGLTEHGEILCLDCAEDDFTKPLIRYSLDEEEMYRSEGMFEEDDYHVADCECQYPVECERCGAALTEGYVDPDCKEKQEGGDL